MSLAPNKLSFQTPGNTPGTIYLAHGGAADIWKISPTPLSERVCKVIRISPERVKQKAPNSSLKSTPNSQASRDFWASFVEEYCDKVRTWSSFSHPNVVRVFGFGDGLNLEVDYYENGCYLKTHSQAIDKANMILDVTAGIEYLHGHRPPIIHGNLNAGKLFVDRNGTTLIGEFGLTALCYPFAAYVPSISYAGFSRWLSPELVNGGPDCAVESTLASDVWALGCTLYEILAETLPYAKHKHEIKVRKEIKAGHLPGHPEHQNAGPLLASIWPIIEGCWNSSPSDRPPASNIAKSATACCGKAEMRRNALQVLKKGDSSSGYQLPHGPLSDKGGVASVNSASMVANSMQAEFNASGRPLTPPHSYSTPLGRPLAKVSPELSFRSAFSSTAQDAFVGEFKRQRQELDRVDVQAPRVAEIDRTKAKLKELHPVDQARYDPSRQCIAGTRVQVIDELVDWTQKSDDGPRLAWVHGLAGLGKSSIATSICMRLDDQEVLASSFFCRRDNPELRDPRRVLTTIVYELALRWEAYRDAVVAVIRDDAKLSSKCIRPLYGALVVKPLRTLAQAVQRAGALVVVVDALDECGDTITRRQLLACLQNMSQLIPSLRIIVTSRPEADIQEFFAGPRSNWFTWYDLIDYNASDDIRLFVRDCLGGLTHLNGWPEDAIEEISVRSSGLFIWARTACMFILSGLDRRKRLEQVLAGTQLASIDALYTTTIQAGVPDGRDNMEDMLKCLGAIIATVSRTPLSAKNLAALLQRHISLDVLERVIGNLSSVLYVDQKLDNAIRIYHPSFMDYMTTKSRSKHLCVDLEVQNTILAETCFRVMDCDLRFNICGLETSHLLNIDVPDLGVRVRKAIQPHLRYSCLYWSSHVAEANLDTLKRPLRGFLFGPQLIYWIEVLSLLGKLSLAPACLLQFVTRCSSESMRDCSILAEDAYRFVLSFYDAISKSTPHLYISALAFAPGGSGISQRMRQFLPKLLTVTQGAEREWTRCLRSTRVSRKVLSVAFSPDSRRIVSGSDDRTVRIWDSETGDPVLEPLKGHTKEVSSAVFSPNGRSIVSGSYDCTIRIWDAETGEPRLGPLRGHSGRIFSVAFSPDSGRIVSGSADETVRVWDAKTGKPVLEPLRGHAGYVRSAAFSPDSRWIVSGSNDRTLRIWDARTGSAVRELAGHLGGVMCVAFSSDSLHIASCSTDRTIRIWDVDTGNEPLKLFEGYSGWVQSVAFSPDSRHIISGSDDKTVRIWDVQTGNLVLDILGSHSGSVRSVAFSADGRRAVSGSSDKTICIWDVVDRGTSGAVENSTTSKGHSGWVESVVFSSDGRYVVSGSEDKTVRIWDAETGVAVLPPFEGHSGGVLSVALSPGDSRVVSGSTDRTVRIWNAKTGDLVLGPLRGHSLEVWSVAFSPDGHRVASGSNDTTVCIWGAGKGAQTLLSLTGHSRSVKSVAFSPNGNRLVSGSDDCTIRIWDAETGQPVLEPLTGHSGYVMSVAFSFDGRRIVSGSLDHTVRIWDAETGHAVLDPLQGHTGWVRSVALSSDGRWIASGSDDRTVRIWDATTGEAALEPLRGHSNYILSVAFSPDSRRIVSGSADMAIRIWDVESHMALTVQNPKFLLDTRVRALPPQAANDKLLVTGVELARHMHPDLAGWVTTAKGKLFVWLPQDLRDIDNSMLCISPTHVRRPVVVDFSAFVHGRFWTLIAED